MAMTPLSWQPWTYLSETWIRNSPGKWSHLALEIWLILVLVPFTTIHCLTSLSFIVESTPFFSHQVQGTTMLSNLIPRRGDIYFLTWKWKKKHIRPFNPEYHEECGQWTSVLYHVSKHWKKIPEFLRNQNEYWSLVNMTVEKNVPKTRVKAWNFIIIVKVSNPEWGNGQKSQPCASTN